ncbi:MAG TPA: site-2 protease family protein [Pyrinomonadaceae bacterium]|nr:site-2 protease family protein [Pyrinomonadaceae bacterium]
MLISSIFFFLLALLLHETAHFAAARACKVSVTEFGLGWGRRLFGFHHGNVRFGLHLLPVGAYVRFNLAELQQRPLPQQVLVLLAGIIANLIAASVTAGSRFSLMNFLLAATNILPLYQQDGWKCGMVVLRSVLGRKSPVVEWTFTITGTVLSLALVCALMLRLFRIH